ncbi:MAG TPA: hypothetical protein VFF43_20020, partial [Caldimonas sp.]|nr:hypothetical protein [Caldimonas sp.]
VSALSEEGLDLLRERIAQAAAGADLNAAAEPASGDVGVAAPESGDEEAHSHRTGTYHSHA